MEVNGLVDGEEGGELVEERVEAEEEEEGEVVEEQRVEVGPHMELGGEEEVPMEDLNISSGHTKAGDLTEVPAAASPSEEEQAGMEHGVPGR